MILMAAAVLVLRTYDTSGVPAAEMKAATETAAPILQRAGIELVWRDCRREGCNEAADGPEMIMRIVTSSGRHGNARGCAADSLGCSMVDAASRSGSFATVYADRVLDFAAVAGGAPGALLGRTIAHEVGHLLLGTSTHSRAGLMRAVWTEWEVRREVPADWWFSPKEAADLRRRLAARATDAFAHQPGGDASQGCDVGID
jgi:hypothetical protein